MCVCIYIYICMYVCIYVYICMYMGLPRWLSGKESAWQYRRLMFDPWVGKIPWRRKWQPTPVFLARKPYGQRSWAGYSPWDHKELDTTQQLNNNNNVCVCVCVCVCLKNIVQLSQVWGAIKLLFIVLDNWHKWSFSNMFCNFEWELNFNKVLFPNTNPSSLLVAVCFLCVCMCVWYVCAWAYMCIYDFLLSASRI